MSSILPRMYPVVKSTKPSAVPWFRWSSTNWKRITRSSLPRNISWLSAGSLALLPAAPHPTAETAYRPATNRSRPAGEQAPPRVSRADQASSRSEEHTSELQSRFDLVCRLLLEKKNKRKHTKSSTNENSLSVALFC